MRQQQYLNNNKVCHNKIGLIELDTVRCASLSAARSFSMLYYHLCIRCNRITATGHEIELNGGNLVKKLGFFQLRLRNVCVERHSEVMF